MATTFFKLNQMIATTGEHGSTYGGNPLACAVAMEALQVLKDENLAQKAEVLGKVFRREMLKLKEKHHWVKEVRGKGLLNAVEVEERKGKPGAWDICLKMMEKGVLAKPTHENIIRFAPPLVITKEQLEDASSKILQAFQWAD